MYLVRTVEEDDEDGEKDPAQDEDSDDEVDEVIGYHFMECTTLFAAYVYVTSASKVFEDRLVNKGLTAEFPDFEAVYHLVIDAVDTYNDQWELAYRLQTQQQQMLVAAANAPPGTTANPVAANMVGGMDLESRRLMFMTEKEKKAELILKQRAELAVKKGTAELEAKVEKTIAAEVLATLEQELNKLLREETEERVHMNLPIARKGIVEDKGNANGGNGNNAAAGGAAKGVVTPGKANATGATTGGAESNSKSKKSPGVPGSAGSSSKKKESILKVADSAIVNLEDLFDLDNFSTTMTSNNEDEAGSAHDDDEQAGSNEFAAELLYIMRLSMSLS